MHFFELVPWVLLVAAVAGGALAIGLIARTMRREDPIPAAEYDCRETALITKGEGVRRDC